MREKLAASVKENKEEGNIDLSSQLNSIFNYNSYNLS